MAELYPLQFEPILRRYLWGGRRLGSVLGKALGDGNDYAESWEVCDHDKAQSVVTNGPLAGTTLGDLVVGHGQQLLGRHHPQPRFPLLFKFLDAQRTLSVQVHPDDRRAAQLDPPDLGKTESWVILEAAPGAMLYAGLKRGFDRAALEREVHRGTCELCLNRIDPRPGDCIFIPAGTVHAIGAGLLVAEIQQASDTTYRLFDFNRVGPDGKPRTLHVDRALEAIDYERGPVAPQMPLATERAEVERLVECEKFVLDRWRLDAPGRIGGEDRFHLIAVLSGEVQASHAAVPEPLASGATLLVPAECGTVELDPRAETTLLDIYLP